MAEIIARRALRLSKGEKLATPPVPLDPETATLLLAIERPTSTQDRDWPEDCTISGKIVVTADGERHEGPFWDFGGAQVMAARNGRPGREKNVTAIAFTPTTGFFGRKSGYPERLGVGKQTYTAHVEIECLSGSLNTFMEVQSRIQQRPRIEFDEFQGKRARGEVGLLD